MITILLLIGVLSAPNHAHADKTQGTTRRNTKSAIDSTSFPTWSKVKKNFHVDLPTHGEGTGGVTDGSTDGSTDFDTDGGTGGRRRMQVPGDWYEKCVAYVNIVRAKEGLPALKRWVEMEACTDDMAKIDSDAGVAHFSFGKQGCEFPSGAAQNTCPNWNNELNSIWRCTHAMWDEKYNPGIDTTTLVCNGARSECGHYYNMRGGSERNLDYNSYDRVACGFYVNDDNELWINQNFGSGTDFQCGGSSSTKPSQAFVEDCDLNWQSRYSDCTNNYYDFGCSMTDCDFEFMDDECTDLSACRSFEMTESSCLTKLLGSGGEWIPFGVACRDSCNTCKCPNNPGLQDESQQGTGAGGGGDPVSEPSEGPDSNSGNSGNGAGNGNEGETGNGNEGENGNNNGGDGGGNAGGDINGNPFSGDFDPTKCRLDNSEDNPDAFECTKCLTKEQCVDAYGEGWNCCPYMKTCVKGGTRCWSNLTADCKTKETDSWNCYEQGWPAITTVCACEDELFPNNWIKGCTETEWQSLVDGSDGAETGNESNEGNEGNTGNNEGGEGNNNGGGSGNTPVELPTPKPATMPLCDDSYTGDDCNDDPLCVHVSSHITPGKCNNMTFNGEPLEEMCRKSCQQCKCTAEGHGPLPTMPPTRNLVGTVGMNGQQLDGDFDPTKCKLILEGNDKVKCAHCLSSAQCKDAYDDDWYCCPRMKTCINSGSMGCSTWAECDGWCHTDTWPQLKEDCSICKAEDFPNNWLVGCTERDWATLTEEESEEQPVETPVEEPVETPVEEPVAAPVEEPSPGVTEAPETPCNFDDKKSCNKAEEGCKWRAKKCLKKEEEEVVENKCTALGDKSTCNGTDGCNWKKKKCRLTLAAAFTCDGQKKKKCRAPKGCQWNDETEACEDLPEIAMKDEDEEVDCTELGNRHCQKTEGCSWSNGKCWEGDAPTASPAAPSDDPEIQGNSVELTAQQKKAECNKAQDEVACLAIGYCRYIKVTGACKPQK